MNTECLFCKNQGSIYNGMCRLCCAEVNNTKIKLNSDEIDISKISNEHTINNDLETIYFLYSSKFQKKMKNKLFGKFIKINDINNTLNKYIV
jgi:hypothetical protein